MQKNYDNQNHRYSFLAKFFHWGFVLLFGYGIIKQVDNIEQLEDISLLKFEIMFASIFLFFLILRFIYMKKTQPTSLPEETPKSQKFAAKLVHYSMYLCLVSICISGLMIGLFFWLGFKNGLVIEFIILIHENSISIIYYLIAIHIIAALYHRFRSDGVWNSMVPLWQEKN
mgnify:FL=1|tara:strand:+ start:2167 stop:2679 length:513 start_codon:yes stop_codon:yes gene_type:complete